MKLTIAVVFIILFIQSSPARAQESDCWKSAQTQRDMEACAGSDFKNADVRMNSLYRQLLAKYKTEPKAIAKIRAAQRTWLKYRDAQLDSYYAWSSDFASSESTCRTQMSTKLTLERVKLLERALKADEGDVCTMRPAESGEGLQPKP